MCPCQNIRNIHLLVQGIHNADWEPNTPLAYFESTQPVPSVVCLSWPPFIPKTVLGSDHFRQVSTEPLSTQSSLQLVSEPGSFSTPSESSGVWDKDVSYETVASPRPTRWGGSKLQPTRLMLMHRPCYSWAAAALAFSVSGYVRAMRNIRVRAPNHCTRLSLVRRSSL